MMLKHRHIYSNSCRLRVAGIRTITPAAAATAMSMFVLATLSMSFSSAASSSAFLLATPATQNNIGIPPPKPQSSNVNHDCFQSEIISRLRTKPTTSQLYFTSQRIHKNTPRTIRYYTDEWLDSEIELAAFNLPRRHRQPSRRQRRLNRTSATTTTPSSKSISTFVRQLVFLPILKFILHLKETIRTKLERSTVYILQCENNKYYVGSTTNRKRRYHQHMHRRGSKWTKVHKPTNILKEYKRIPSIYLLGMESKVTAQTMLQYGVNNVRGSMFCSVRNYHMGDIDALTKFLGHYNDLEYGRVYSKLCRMLPPPPMQRLLEEEEVTGGSGGGSGGSRRRGGKSWRKNAENVDDVVIPSSSEAEDDPLEGGTSTP